jgi:hypothetical protein
VVSCRNDSSQCSHLDLEIWISTKASGFKYSHRIALPEGAQQLSFADFGAILGATHLRPCRFSLLLSSKITPCPLRLHLIAHCFIDGDGSTDVLMPVCGGVDCSSSSLGVQLLLTRTSVFITEFSCAGCLQ